MTRQMTDLGEETSSSPRHFMRASRVEVLGSVEPGMKGTWLPTDDANRALKVGFYDDGTYVRVHTRLSHIDLWIKGNRLYKNRDCTEEYMGNFPKTLTSVNREV